MAIKRIITDRSKLTPMDREPVIGDLLLVEIMRNKIFDTAVLKIGPRTVWECKALIPGRLAYKSSEGTWTAPRYENLQYFSSMKYKFYFINCPVFKVLYGT